MTLDELRIIARSLAESTIQLEDIEQVKRKDEATRIVMRELKLKTLDPRLPENTDARSSP